MMVHVTRSIDEKIRDQEARCSVDRRRLEDLIAARFLRIETKIDAMTWRIGLIWGGALALAFAAGLVFEALL